MALNFSKLIVITVLIHCSGCVSLPKASTNFDPRAYAILSLNMFNQRIDSNLRKKSWKGDWLFRRERLRLIDSEINRLKPDILFFQESLDKRNSPTESDQKILTAGSLKNFYWYKTMYQEYKESAEQESLVVSLNAKTKENNSPPLLFGVAQSGYIMIKSLATDSGNIIAVNLFLQSRISDSWFGFISAKIKEIIRSENSCKERVIVAVSLSNSVEFTKLQKTFFDLNLKNSSENFCKLEGQCQTVLNSNELFVTTNLSTANFQADHIFVPQNAIVFNASPEFKRPVIASTYVKEFGLNKLWPSHHLGWFTQVQLPVCP